MKKVNSVINGYIKQYDIEEITIFEGDDKVIFSGKLNCFLNTDNQTLYKEKLRILKSECKRCIVFNRRKLFVFID